MSKDSRILHEGLQAYLQKTMTPENPTLIKLHEATNHLSNAQMQSSPEGLRFIQMIIKLTRAKKVLEVGTFTGYASLGIALALPEDGKLITCDINEETIEVGKPFWKAVSMEEKITVKIGDAVQTLHELIQQGKKETFDLCFIDANKGSYKEYYEACLTLLRPGGVLLIDNTLWSGDVAREEDQSRLTVKIRELNQYISEDARVEGLIVPLADGITLVRKNN